MPASSSSPPSHLILPVPSLLLSPSAPQPPDEKKRLNRGVSGRWGCLVAIGLCFAVLFSPVFLSGGEISIETAPFVVVLYAIIIVAIFVANPGLILIAVLVIGVVIGVVCWGMAKRREMEYKPPIAPQPLPRTQWVLEESSRKMRTSPRRPRSHPSPLALWRIRPFDSVSPRLLADRLNTTLLQSTHLFVIGKK